MANKSNGLESDWARVPPPTGPFWERCAKAIYNPEERSFLGRTPKRWGIVLLFYSIFYAVLALMFALCMGGLFLTLDYRKPAYILDSSLIGANPGVACRPQPLSGLTVEYRRDDNGTRSQQYVEELRQFVQLYANESWFTSKKECAGNDNYGYPDTPCFFIKLNKIYGWKPEFFEGGDLPADMSSELVEHINSRPSLERQQVWVSCWSEGGNDTKIEYPWGMGIAGRFYPYMNEDGYLSPLVAVKIIPTVNALAVVRCRAWAKNIIYNKSIKEPSGYVRIQLKIEDHTMLESTATTSI